MNIAVRYEVPSPEADFVAFTFCKEHKVTMIPLWVDGKELATDYDVAFCVGPVQWCPTAKSKVLLAFGPVSLHRDLDYDIVVASCKKSLIEAGKQFSYASKIRIIEPAILGLEAGKKRLVTQIMHFVHASPVDLHKGYYPAYREIKAGVKEMKLWGSNSKAELFDSLDFNSRVKMGAVGYYPASGDGFDVQIRRHLALGGKVICRRDEDMLGDLADICLDWDSKSLKEDLESSSNIEPVNCAGSQDDYSEQLKEILLDL